MQLSDYARKSDIGYRAVWNRFKVGKIPFAHKDEHGRIRIPEPATHHHTPDAAVIYARVSTHKQKDDLARQAKRMSAFATANGLQLITVVTEVASGVNDTRPKLTKLLQDPDWSTLVIEHKDRLPRVGFEWFATLLGVQGKRILVANTANEDTGDLMEDFVSIINSFAARLHGLRSARRRTDATVKRRC